MRKLIIHIPCYNEADVLPQTLADLPRAVAGFDRVEWLVTDDGSTDGTSAVARAHGVDHVIRLPANRGLANAFMVGVLAALERGADVIVNTDADNQYDASCIPDLVAPILEGRAVMVVGARPIMDTTDFPLAKKLLQRIGSWVVRVASGTPVPDAPSGFRAFSRDAALSLYVFNAYTYTLETLIQAGRLGMTVTWVPIRTHAPTRPSRLFRSMRSYVLRSMATIFRIFVLYKPMRFFALIGALVAIPGLVLGLRFLYFFMLGQGSGNIQSLILVAILIVSSVVIFSAGVLSDMIAANRVLLAEIRRRQLQQHLETSSARIDGPHRRDAP
ncbi:glycosyltransferase family 2 protein [Roseospira visakhapatnamensis]|uniref:Glycosyltransferase involved in cell wall biosynthesis n=1 Tax=Roseospira visakhapatnamensis TaxID=390880 RepID=A0A7W6RF69_9PROT|nr:glycosyltransferase family 2 protein [Roseospira visakhapatnamensis]MBB4267429.1 glycosyltransferase involved in cell wall biosynthesis [Roseospira visakhapatnamensis]